MAAAVDLTETQKEWALQAAQVLSGQSSNFPSAATSSESVRLSTNMDKARNERRRALILPREHGAWGLLLVPMVTGAGVAFRESSHVVPFLLLLTSALALFWLRTPVESLLGTSPMRAQTSDERCTVAGVIVGLSCLAGLTLGALLWAGRNPYLWLIGGVAGLAFVSQAMLKKLGRNFRMISEIVGTVGLTGSAPAAYYVVTGKFGATAWVLWLANLLFAGDQIHYVQFRIHTAKLQGLRAKLSAGWRFALGQGLMTAVLTIMCMGRLMPALASLAFAPLLFRGWYYFIQERTPLMVRRLGWSELTHALCFCVLFIVAFVSH